MLMAATDVTVTLELRPMGMEGLGLELASISARTQAGEHLRKLLGTDIEILADPSP